MKELLKKLDERNSRIQNRLLFFINTSIVISYIAGACALQIPFFEVLGLIPYDLTYYLIIGIIFFILIFITNIISGIIEVFTILFSEKLAAKLKSFLDKYYIEIEYPGIGFFLRLVIFAPITYFVICFIESKVTNYIKLEEDFTYINFLIYFLFTYIKIYTPIKILFTSNYNEVDMYKEKFLLIVISLVISINIHNSSIEHLLLKDALLLDADSESEISIIYLNDDNLYYKSNGQYRYRSLESTDQIIFNP
ncbi:MAG: hypothetical protein ACI4LO_07785 [Anaerovoracaceae bacterium]